MTDQPVRDDKGRFKPGASGNPRGRLPRPVEDRVVQRLAARLNNGDYDRILDAVVNRAQRGDIQAARLLLEYAVGKPLQRVDMTADIGLVVGGVDQIMARVYGGMTDDGQDSDS